MGKGTTIIKEISEFWHYGGHKLTSSLELQNLFSWSFTLCQATIIKPLILEPLENMLNTMNNVS